MRIAIWVVLATFLSAPVLAEQTWKPVGPLLVAALDVDAQGHVTHAQLVGDNILPALQTLVVQTTRNWRFVPASVDGKVEPSRTYASLAAEARGSDNNEQLRLRYVRHGPGPVAVFQPTYPPEMIRQRIEAKVIADASVAADGTLFDVHIIDAETSGGEKGKLFYLAVISAIEKDRFLPEMVDGRPVITHMRIPVTFNLNIMGGAAAFGNFARAKDAPHGTADDSKFQATRFASDPVALDSPLKLVSTQP